MKKSRGPIRRFICIVAVSILFTGCVKTYRTDFVKKYQKYLKYSLGDYDYDKRTIQSTSDPIPQVNKYTEWNLKYKDADGNDKSFIINNFYSDSKNVKMAQLAYRQACNICSDEIGAKVCSEYFDYVYDKNKVSLEKLPVTYVLVNGDYYTERSKSFYDDCIDSKYGIELKSIKAKEFQDKWDCTFKISIVTADIKNEEKLNEIIVNAKSMLKDYSDYLDLDKAAVDINYSQFDQLFKITYDRKNTSYDVENLLEKEGKNTARLVTDELLDGHLKYISTYIVNGKRLVWLDKAQYDEERKTYYLGSYYYLLKALDIEFEKFDRRVGTPNFKWKVGNDIFEAYTSYPEKILKNNYGIARPKSFSPSNGVTPEEFESISNTVVEIDEKNEAIIINSR